MDSIPNTRRNFFLFHGVQRRLRSMLLKYAEGQHCPQLNQIKNVETSEEFRRFIVNLNMPDHLFIS